MGLAPLRDRTISLRLESEVSETKGNKKVSTKKTDSFVRRFMPNKTAEGFISSRLPGEGAVFLRGPTKVSWGFEAAIGDDQGIFTSHLQPWFIKSIPISIDGSSYIGAFPGLSVSDQDVEKTLQKFKKTSSDFTPRNGQKGNKERFVLEIRGGPRGTRRFMGYLLQLNFSEDVKDPYFLNYSIRFIGRNIEEVAVADGKAKGDEMNRTANGENPKNG